MQKLIIQTQNILKNYLQIFPEEKNLFDLLGSQLNDKEDIFSRKNFRWHITASAFFLSADKSKIALIHNINLDKWLAPGWHYEFWDNEIYNTAKREALEETWLSDFEFLPWHSKNNFVPIDIDTHYIPKNSKKQEPEHFHHDFRYVFVLKNKYLKINIQKSEIKWFKWLDIWENFENNSINKVLKKLEKISL